MLSAYELNRVSNNDSFFLTVKVRVYSLDENLKPLQKEVPFNYYTKYATNLNRNLTMAFSLYEQLYYYNTSKYGIKLSIIE